MSYPARPEPVALVNPNTTALRQNNIAFIVIIIIIIAIIIIIVIVAIRGFNIKPPIPKPPECTVDSDCPTAVPKCDPRTNKCAICLTNSDCKVGDVCDDKVCVKFQCANNSQCGGSTPLCDVITGSCRQCLTATNCPVANSLCNFNGVCIEPCTSAPDPITDSSTLTVTNGVETNTVSWVEPSTTLGRPIKNYFVMREANACGLTQGNIVDLQIIPRGTNTTIFKDVKTALNCYRVVTGNDCGIVSANSSAAGTGFVCLFPPVPPPKNAIRFTFNNPAQCSIDCSNNTADAACGITLDWSILGSSTNTDLLLFMRSNVYFFSQAAGQILVTPNESNIVARLGIANSDDLSFLTTWNLLCGRSSQVTAQRISGAATGLVTNLDPSNNFVVYNLPANPLIAWTQVIGANYYIITISEGQDANAIIYEERLRLIDLLDPANPFIVREIPSQRNVQIRVSGYNTNNPNFAERAVLTNLTPVPYVGPRFYSVPANPTIRWNVIPGADEYAITLVRGSQAFGIIVPVKELTDPRNPSVTFISVLSSFEGEILVYGYPLCAKSSPVRLDSLFN